jgi:hypothetical protein
MTPCGRPFLVRPRSRDGRPQTFMTTVLNCNSFLLDDSPPPFSTLSNGDVQVVVGLVGGQLDCVKLSINVQQNIVLGANSMIRQTLNG